MPDFIPLSCEDDLKQIIKSAFDSDLDVSGDWGYSQELSTIIVSSDVPIKQFEHIFASMRAYVEMNMTREEDSRYGSINVNELTREELTLEGLSYHKVTYGITAIKEDIYAKFIKEYKENYGKESFDLNLHFQQRKEATLHREATHWFKIL